MRLVFSLALSLSLACSGAPLAPPPGQDALLQPAAAPAADPLPPPAKRDGGPPGWALRGLCDSPQIRDGRARYEQAARWGGGPLKDALLLCDVALTPEPPKGRRWDAFGNAPDPAAELRVGDAARGCAGASDTFGALLSWPRVSLPEGGKLGLSVQDEDLERHDFAGMDLEIFAGTLPLDLRGDHFTASCRALGGQAVAALVPAQQEAARGALRALQAGLAPDALAPDWGFPRGADAEGQRAVEDVAGYVGWDDERVQGLLSQYEALLARWTAQATASVQAYRATASRRADLDDGLRAEVQGRACSDACVVTLSLASDGERVLDLFGSEGNAWAFSAVLPDGRDLALQVEGDPSEQPLPAGTTALRLVEAGVEGRLSQAVLLRIAAPSGQHYVLAL